MDEGFGDREGQFGSTDDSRKNELNGSDDWMGNREGQFGSSNPLTTKPVLDEWPGNREQQR